VLVQDLSGSFGDDMRTLRQLAPSIADDIATIFPDNQLGITSFIDKPQPGWPGVYEYRLELALTSDRDAFIGAVNALTTTFNYDSAESSLSALFYTAAQADQVGWRDTGGVKIAIVLTDDAYKQAGDRPFRGPNDGDDVLDGDPPGTGEGYPDVDMVRQALLDEGITPVFAVTRSFISTYQGLVDELGFGAVVELAPDSSNLDQAIREIIQTQGQTLIENAIGSDFGDTLIGNTVDNVLRGRGGDDTLSGKRGDDTLVGGDGNDRAFGGDGNDMLSGGAGDDFLFGGAGSDDLRGGAGSDRMFGGAGADRFILREAGDFDRIMDFEAARDRILISEAATGIGSLAELQAAATERAAGVDVAFDTGLLRIRGIELADLTEGNVLFLA
jgi:Ca2+-binding RTX toxin-like protein